VRPNKGGSPVALKEVHLLFLENEHASLSRFIIYTFLKQLKKMFPKKTGKNVYSFHVLGIPL
jgi:hypothetical protein